MIFESTINLATIVLFACLFLSPSQLENQPGNQPETSIKEGIYRRNIIAECQIECWQRTSKKDYQKSIERATKEIEKNIDINDLINCTTIIVDFQVDFQVGVQHDKNLFGFIFCDGLRETSAYYFNCRDFTVDKLRLSMYIYDELQKKYGNGKMGGKYGMEKHQKKKLIVSFMEK